MFAEYPIGDGTVAAGFEPSLVASGSSSPHYESNDAGGLIATKPWFWAATLGRVTAYPVKPLGRFQPYVGGDVSFARGDTRTFIRKGIEYDDIDVQKGMLGTETVSIPYTEASYAGSGNQFSGLYPSIIAGTKIRRDGGAATPFVEWKMLMLPNAPTQIVSFGVRMR